jgi:hypothetical protein
MIRSVDSQKIVSSLRNFLPQFDASDPMGGYFRTCVRCHTCHHELFTDGHGRWRCPVCKTMEGGPK